MGAGLALCAPVALARLAVAAPAGPTARIIATDARGFTVEILVPEPRLVPVRTATGICRRFDRFHGVPHGAAAAPADDPTLGWLVAVPAHGNPTTGAPPGDHFTATVRLEQDTIYSTSTPLPTSPPRPTGDPVQPPPPPLAVELTAFHASRRGPTVVLDWRTRSELKNLGFRVLREERGGGLIVVSSRLIPSRAEGGEIGGAEYRFMDVRAPRERVRY